MSDEAFNSRVSSDRILVEKFFGWLCNLWSLFAVKWRWNLGLYDGFFRVADALTNFHIKSHPLWQQDGDKYVELRNRLHHIANETIENRRRVLSRYQERRRRRLNQQFRRNQFCSHRTLESTEWEINYVVTRSKNIYRWICILLNKYQSSECLQDRYISWSKSFDIG